ncbi:uncharacterized protein V1518DRAFT_403751 [Limtongia smithiae]|uniref:uncharacterized protein n=1 Tax=Limtongia smithiae TaxID=1125753 RepID=UPI0034CE2459
MAPPPAVAWLPDAAIDAPAACATASPCPAPAVCSPATATALPDPPAHFGGLANTGNTCFLNCVVQALASSRSVVRFLAAAVADSATVSAADSLSCDRARTTRVELAQLLACVNAAEPHTHTYAPRALLATLGAVDKRWSEDAEQQDAHEFLLALIQALRTVGDDCEDETRLPVDGVEITYVVCTLCREVVPRRRVSFSCIELSIPEQPVSPSPTASYFMASPTLGGLFLADPQFQHLSREHSVTLEELLRSHAVQGSGADVYCPRCSLVGAQAQLQRLLERTLRPAVLAPYSQHADESEDCPSPPPSPTVMSPTSAANLSQVFQTRIDAISEALRKDIVQDDDFERMKPPRLVSSRRERQLVISDLPKTLVLHVNRSQFDSSLRIATKNNTRVAFPERLPFAQFMRCDAAAATAPPPLMRPGEPTYRLSSTVVHYGSHSFGHYVTYRRAPAPASNPTASFWLRASDADVHAVPLSEVLEQGNVTLLFYELEDDAATTAVITTSTDIPSFFRGRLSVSTSYDVHDSSAEHEGLYTPPASPQFTRKGTDDAYISYDVNTDADDDAETNTAVNMDE